MTIGLETFDDLSRFDPAQVRAPWQEFTTWSTWDEAVGWAMQAMRITVDRIRTEVGDGSVDWNEFYAQLNTTFEGTDAWYWHPIIQRLLKAAREREPSYPLHLSNELLVEAGFDTQRHIDGWYTDTSDLLQLAHELQLDPVGCGWIVGPATATNAQPEPQQQATSARAQQPGPAAPNQPASENAGLPSVEEVMGYFDEEKKLTPAQEARVQLAWSQGLITLEDDDA